MTLETGGEVDQEQNKPTSVASASPEPAIAAAVNHQESTTDENTPIVTVEKEEKAPIDEQTPNPIVANNNPPGGNNVTSPTTGKQAVAVQNLNKKTHLEQRLRRHFMWKSMSFVLFCGRVLSKLGVRNAQHLTARKASRLGAGFRREKLPGISHAKALVCGVKCRVYRHIGDEGPRPVLIYAHGGGWLMCSARTYHQFTLGLCRDTGATVVSIDYRLAPENPYPAGLEDCLAVVRAILHADTNPDEVGPELKGFVDVNRVVMGGDSAGGNLTACVALEMIRAGEDRRLHAQILVCPTLQAVTQSFESYVKNAKAYTTGLSWFLPHYAGVLPNKRLMKLITQGRHVPEETSQRLIAKYMTVPHQNGEADGQQTKTADPDSGCQTASSSLPSPAPQVQPVQVQQPAAEATMAAAVEPAVEINGETPAPGENEATEKKATSPVPPGETSGPLVVPVTSNAESHVETDQLIEKTAEIPESITDLVTCVRAWPMLAEDSELAQLPTTMIQVCSDDPLLDEGRIFADRMRLSGCKEVRYFFLPRAQHAEAILGKYFHSKAAKRGYAEITSFFKDVTGIEDEASQKVETPGPAITAIDATEEPTKQIEPTEEPIAAS